MDDPRATADEDFPPLERELREGEAWLIRLRWAVGASLVWGSFVGLPLVEFQLPYWPLTAVGLAVLAYNVVLWQLRRRSADTARSRHGAVHLQILLDWVALAATVLLTGGITSPFSIVFVFHLIVSALLLSRWAQWLLTAAAVLLMGLAALLAGRGVLPKIAALPEPGSAPRHALDTWVALLCLFVSTTYIASTIMGRLRRQGAALERSERSLKRAYDGMLALHEIGQLVNSTLEMNEVLSLIAEHAARLLNGHASTIRLLDRTGTTLELGGAFGLSAAYVQKGAVRVENSRVDAEALAGGVIQVFEVAADPRFQYPGEAQREGLRSVVTGPMRARNRTLGVIRVYTREPRVFTEQEETLLLNLANLGAVAIENARAYGELQAVDRERVWFARTTHHQLRSPLAAVQGAIDALEYAGPLNDLQRELVGRARRRVQDAFDTIRDLLDLAAAQRLEAPAAREPVRLEAALARVIETTQERCKAKGLAFRAAFATAGRGVKATPQDLERIFANLLDNAVKYTRAGSVSFSARSQSGWLEAIVDDTGIGIAEEDQPRIYEGFFRAATAKETGEVGTGLGMSVVQSLVRRLGGTIALDSEVGRGTTFTVRLPDVAIGASPELAAAPAAAGSRPAPSRVVTIHGFE